MVVLPSKLSLILNAYIPGLFDSKPVQNLRVLRSAKLGRNLHASFPTAANSQCSVQSGDREPTAPVKQDSSPSPHGSFFTEYGAVGSSIAASTCSPIGLNQVKNFSVFLFDFRPVGFQRLMICSGNTFMVSASGLVIGMGFVQGTQVRGRASGSGF